MTENWLTKKPRPFAGIAALVSALLLLMTSSLYWHDVGGAEAFMPASRDAVINHHEYWRLWTALFAHADTGHLMNNAVLFIPLAYLLTAYFGVVLFPLFAFAAAGLMNYIVLAAMPQHVELIGISGLVNWMGAAWFALYVLIDRRERLRRRLAYSIFLTLILFVPEKYHAEVSYFSHFVGFGLGLASGFLFYAFNRRKIRSADVFQTDNEEDFHSSADVRFKDCADGTSCSSGI